MRGETLRVERVLDIHGLAAGAGVLKHQVCHWTPLDTLIHQQVSLGAFYVHLHKRTPVVTNELRE